MEALGEHFHAITAHSAKWRLIRRRFSDRYQSD
jgi:hypothetical protein